ncbi:MAG TPA: isoprenylcysteine carboxylmethyltransferase family protein [Xanthobacteraceae bacterium]|nr:isoprenylcysteine carboxylmethyltransferase family protein [Xanthobacteraceae bacterium]
MVAFKPVQKLLAMFNSVMARSSFGIDAIFRMPSAIFFGLLAFSVVRRLVVFILQWSTLDIPYKPLRFASILANALFLFTLLSLTVLRSRPVKSSTTLSARLMAIIGTCLPLSLGLLPLADLPPAVTLISIVLIGSGCGLAIWTAFWLGRSFSLAPQARQLVVGGAYSVVRHPLYLCEELAVLGAMLACFSTVAVAIVVIHWSLQLKRMEFEEQVLTATFPEYASYAATVPRLIPHW